MHTALEAANALVKALGMRFGSVVIEVSDGDVTVARMGIVLKAKDLAEQPVSA